MAILADTTDWQTVDCQFPGSDIPALQNEMFNTKE